MIGEVFEVGGGAAPTNAIAAARDLAGGLPPNLFALDDAARCTGAA
jgi:hypothetical protein